MGPDVTLLGIILVSIIFVRKEERVKNEIRDIFCRTVSSIFMKNQVLWIFCNTLSLFIYSLLQKFKITPKNSDLIELCKNNIFYEEDKIDLRGFLSNISIL